MTLSGFLIGGAIPAICLGLGTIFMRASLGAGASIPLYLAIEGGVVAALGWAAFIWTGAPILSVQPVLLAAATGTTWTLAIACMVYGMGVLKLPVSILAPLTSRRSASSRAAPIAAYRCRPGRSDPLAATRAAGPARQLDSEGVISLEAQPIGSPMSRGASGHIRFAKGSQRKAARLRYSAVAYDWARVPMSGAVLA